MSFHGKSLLGTATLLALCFLGYPAQAQVSTRDEAAASSLLSKITIYNFGQINSTYYRGAQPKGQDYAALAAIGIRTVIDLQKDGDDREPELVENAGMTYINIPMTTRVVPTPEKLAQFLALVNDPASQPVYVHCAEGRHRTGVMTAVYRMVGDGWTPDQAYKEMKEFRFGMSFLHPEFKRFVYSFRPESVPSLAPIGLAPAIQTQ